MLGLRGSYLCSNKYLPLGSWHFLGVAAEYQLLVFLEVRCFHHSCLRSWVGRLVRNNNENLAHWRLIRYKLLSPGETILLTSSLQLSNYPTNISIVSNNSYNIFFFNFFIRRYIPVPSWTRTVDCSASHIVCALIYELRMSILRSALVHVVYSRSKRRSSHRFQRGDSIETAQELEAAMANSNVWEGKHRKQQIL